MAHREPNVARRSLIAAVLSASLLAAASAPASADFVNGDESPVNGSGTIDGSGNVNVELTGATQGGSSGSSGGSSGTWVGYDIGLCGANGEVWLDVAVSTRLPRSTELPAGRRHAHVHARPPRRHHRRHGAVEPVPRPAAAHRSAVGRIHPRASPTSRPATSPPARPARGLVGFENWFWYEGEMAVPVTATLDGWTGTATAPRRRLALGLRRRRVGPIDGPRHTRRSRRHAHLHRQGRARRSSSPSPGRPTSS